MRELLDKLVSEAPEQNGVRAVEVQLYFKASFIVPTQRGPVASNVAAGALAAGPVPGTFKLLTVGDDQNRKKIMVESIFEADAISRVDRMTGPAEESSIVKPNGSGGLYVPGAQ
jgi:hypothetical protein